MKFFEWGERTLFVVSLVAVLLLAGCTAPQGADNESEEKIKIGAVLPLTGKVAFWGEPVLKGMKFAVNEINREGGINGREVEILVRDSKADPKTAVKATRSLFGSDPVAYSVHTTGVSNAVAPVLEKKQIPVITNAADTGLPLDHNYTFKTFYNAYSKCKEMARYATSERGMEKFGLLLSKTPWGEWCAKGVKEEVGEENTVGLRYQFQNANFGTLLTKAKQADVDGMFWLGFPFESNKINKKKAELDVEAPLICGYGHECVSKSSLSEVPSKYLEDYLVFRFDISEDYKNRYGKNLSEGDFVPSAFGYDEIHIIADALKECDQVSRSCLRKNLPEVEGYPTALNSRGFDEMKNLIIDTELYTVEDGSLVPEDGSGGE